MVKRIVLAFFLNGCNQSNLSIFASHNDFGKCAAKIKFFYECPNKN